MPQRPSRFKRRVQAAGAYNPVAASLGIHNASSTSHVNTSNVSSLTHTVIELDPAKYTGLRQAEGNPRPEPVICTDSIYHIPRSPVPAELRSSSAVGRGRDAHGGHSSVERRSNLLLVSQAGRKAGVARSSKSKLASSKPPGSSSTRKRRLPVNGLALLRTTTSDGLPDPCDADAVFVAPVTKTDPIQDSQAPILTRLSTLRTRGSGSKAISEQRKGLSPRKNNVVSGQPTRSPTSIYRRLPTPITGKRPPPLDFVGCSDGFSGCEFRFVSKKRPTRRGKTPPTERKTLPFTRGLPLASGLLPIPVVESIVTSVSMERSNVQYLDCLHRPSGPEIFQDTTRSGQLLLTRSQSVIEDEHARGSRSQQWERAIRNQLSSITAPIRGSSESSGSDAAPEEQSSNGDKDTNTDDVDDVDADYVASLARHPTIVVDDTSYFEQAMQHLDEADMVERADEYAWAQNNAME